ncbi:MAG: hypothetical protein ACRDOF_03820 [Gaiellaceae bacterium]
MVDVSQSSRETSAPRINGIVGGIDRFFPLAWIGFYLLLPVSGWASVMFDSWFDQKRDLEALRSVLADGRADAIADSVIGPAYIATAAWLHSVVGLSAEDALVWLTRGSYVLGAAAGMVIVRVAVRRLVATPPMASIAAQLLFVSLVFAAGTWHWSDVPWSHFFAAFLAVSLYALRYAPARVSLAQALVVGAVLALLALTRSFELVALVAAWGIGIVVLAALRLSGPRLWRAQHIVAAFAAFAVTVAAVYLTTGKRDLFFLYSNHLDRQSGNVLSAEVAETPTFSLSLVPVKLVQLFVEPCYYSMCSLSDYAGGASPLSPELAGAAGNERLWRLPLAVQLPALVLLPLCVIAVVALIVWFSRNGAAGSARARELRLLLEMAVAASGIVLGYVASTLTGSSHLRYGFARDFLLPALLTSVVSVSLVAAGLWLVLSRRRRRGLVSPEFRFVMLSFALAAGVVTAATVGRSHGLPRIESRQLGPVSYAARCRGDMCDIAITAKTRSGAPISIPEASTLTFGCGSSRAQLSIYVSRPTEGVGLPTTCRDPRLVAAWPTVMGLPPGSYELGFVGVENVAPGS